MAGPQRAFLLSALIVLVAACGASNPSPTIPIAAATATASAMSTTTSPPPPTRSPSAEPPTPLPSPTPSHRAALSVTGEGSCQVINYGGCWTVLLIEQAEARSLFDWTPSDADMEFELDYGGSNVFENIVIGPPPNAPTALEAGRWAVGLGLGESSDVVGTPDSGGVLCVREFSVNTDTERVEINAAFKDPCRIDVTIEPPPPWTGQTGGVPPWSPPTTGVMDDCHYRRALIQIDPDGRPWYEEVDSGQRIEINLPWLDGAQYIFDADPRVITADGTELRENDLIELTCVFETDRGVAWVGGLDYAWLPWEARLGTELAGAAQHVMRAGRQHEGGAPPAAVTVTSPRVAAPDRELFRQLDAEFRQVGGDAWSLVRPEFWLGNEVGGPGRLPEVLGLAESVSITDNTLWYLRWHDPGTAPVPAEGFGRHVSPYTTPRGNNVFAVDETLRAWDDCAAVDVPPITPSDLEPGYEASVDKVAELVSFYIYDAVGDGHAQLVASYADPACRAHPILGPIIDRALAE